MSRATRPSSRSMIIATKIASADPDHAEPRPGVELVPGSDVAHDPAGDDAGDLHHGDPGVLALQPDGAALVALGAGIVRRRESAGRVQHLAHHAADRRPVDVNVE